MGAAAALLAAVFWLLSAPAAARAGAAPGPLADGVLSYGADAEGGAPYVFYDPEDPGKLVGFEVEIVAEIAARLGVKPELRQKAWESLIPALNRGDSDLVINGIELTGVRLREAAFTRPYYLFQQQLTVRADETRIRSRQDLSGLRVGTLIGSLAQELLGQVPGVRTVTYPGVLEPYEDLAAGRIDAVFLDLPIAAYYAGNNPRLKPAGPPEGEGFYAVAVRRSEPELLAAVDGALAGMMLDGTLKRILERWKLWNGAQLRLAAPAAAAEAAGVPEEPPEAGHAAGPGAPLQTADGTPVPLQKPDSWWKYLPHLLRGAGMTFALSAFSMALAVTLGLGIALTRLYGGTPARAGAAAYVEIVRGTPLLIQLYLLYYGLPALGVKLPALGAAVLGLGLNYAAFESEIYRAGILSIPRGQTEAAESLGMTRWQTLRFVLLPQTVRTVLPPVTNDFIAMLKDSSLVSVITVVELTKAYSIHAAATFSYLELGLMSAGLYLLMSLPLSRLSRHLERRARFAD